MSGCRSTRAWRAPPGPTGASWRGSPTITSLPRARLTASRSRARSTSAVRLASSSTSTDRWSSVTCPWSRRHSSDRTVPDGDVGVVVEGAGGLAAGGGAQHPIAGGLQCPGGHVEGGGLAGAGHPDDDIDRPTRADRCAPPPAADPH